MESKKRLYDLFPELKKEYDPRNPDLFSNDRKLVRHFINSPEDAGSEDVDLITADQELQRDGIEHPKHLSKLNKLRRLLNIK